MLLFLLLSCSSLFSTQDVRDISSLKKLCSIVIEKHRLDMSYLPPMIELFRERDVAEYRKNYDEAVERLSRLGFYPERYEDFNIVFFSGGPWDKYPRALDGLREHWLRGSRFNVLHIQYFRNAMFWIIGCPVIASLVGFLIYECKSGDYLRRSILNYQSNPNSWLAEERKRQSIDPESQPLLMQEGFEEEDFDKDYEY